MEQFKSVWQSLGVQGSLTSIISILAMVFLAKPMAAAGITTEDLTQSILGLVAAVGAVLGLVGRLTATKKLVTSKETATVLNARLVSPTVTATPGK